MVENFFEIVIQPMQNVLASMGFEKADTDNSDCVIFKNSEVAYKVEFDGEKKQYKLSVGSVDDGEIGDSWKIKSAWLFDPQVNTRRDAEDIALDFKETVGGAQKPLKKSAQKGAKDGEHNADPLFFANRMANVFPQLKDEIAKEKCEYESFRGVTFAKDKILPRMTALLNGNVKNAQVKKFFEILNDMYRVGNLDVRGIITIVLLNAIEDSETQQIVHEKLSEELQRAWKSSRKLNGKIIKPEKAKRR